MLCVSPAAREAKLLAAIRANPQNVRFADACRAARLLGFVHEGGKGSHRVHQGRQLVRMIDKYGSKR